MHMHMQSSVLVALLVWVMTTLHAHAAPAPAHAAQQPLDDLRGRLKGVCPDFAIRCVLDGNWSKPVGYLDKKPFCREGLRCNQCDQVANTRECNRELPDCMRACEAYGPIPF